jgi:UDP-N-acetylmuramate dehydrogenase
MIREKKLLFLKKKLGKRVKVNEPLAWHTTFRIGGPADIFFEAKTKEELIKAVEQARELKIPFFILGSGSNILVADKGFKGIVIKYQVSSIRLVKTAEENSLTGLEFAVGIPGTVGGAVVGNSGVKDKMIGDLVEKVKVLNEKGEVVNFTQAQCQFGYRHSLFQEEQKVILEAILKLSKGEQQDIKEKMKEYLRARENQPREPSAGSIFKNFPEKTATRLGAPTPAAGWFIDQCGLKGKRIGNAQISEKHANWIVNLGSASCQDVIKLISLAKKRVKAKFGIELEEEIKRVGEV